MNIKQALSELDVEADHHWTADGAPRVDVVQELMNDKNLTRGDITNAAPDFTRESAEGGRVLIDADNKETASAQEGDQEGREAEASPAEEVADVAPHSEADEATKAAEEVEPVTEPVADSLTLDVEPPEPPVSEVTEPVSEPAETIVQTIDVASAKEFAKSVEPRIPIVKSELEMLEDDRTDATERMTASQKVAEDAKTEAGKASDEVNALNRRIDMLQKADPHHDTAGIRAYLRAQNKIRENRARGLHRFVEAAGVTPAALAKALNPKAPIDQAMSQRKPARGTTRPVYGQPVQPK